LTAPPFGCKKGMLVETPSGASCLRTSSPFRFAADHDISPASKTNPFQTSSTTSRGWPVPSTPKPSVCARVRWGVFISLALANSITI